MSVDSSYSFGEPALTHLTPDQIEKCRRVRVKVKTIQVNPLCQIHPILMPIVEDLPPDWIGNLNVKTTTTN